MEDLLQSQLRQSFKLAVPEGLRDLMCDISREVLRAQPPDLYHFIVNYLEALLLARDTLCIACQLCGEVCNCTCQPELDEELRNLGLDGDDLETAKNVVLKHFDKGKVNEVSLMRQLLKKTDIDINILEDVQEVVRAAFLKHHRHRHSQLEEEAEITDEPGQNAAKQTLQVYEKAKTKQEEDEDSAAAKIQAAFRGHLVTASLDKEQKPKKHEAEVKSEDVIEEPQMIADRMTVPMIMVDPGTPRASASKSGAHVGRLSSTSLAGSLINLPKYMPYSVHDMTYLDFEEHETERGNIYYTHDSHADMKKEDKKKILFHEQHVLHEIESCSVEEESEEQDIVEEIPSDSTTDNESDEKIEDIVIKVTYNESEEEQLVDDSIFIENIVKEALSFVNKVVHDQVENEQNRIHYEHELHEQEGHYDKSIDDDNIDEDSLQEEQEDKKKKIKAKYVKADDEMMKTLKEKLMKLSSSEMEEKDD